MAEDQSGKASVHQDVAAASDAHTAGRDVRACPVVFGSQGVQIGEGNTQINNYFLGRTPDEGPPGTVPDTAARRLLSDVTDPFDLEVHRPVRADGQGHDLPVLPTYVARVHDQQLSEVTQAAANGKSGIAVLVGGSSTGKTRACWEALRILREQPEPWRLWHPIDPSRPEAALRELAGIGPRTVVWLNEAQFYLAADDGAGEKVAAGLRSLLREPCRAPVLVLATLWPEYWGQLADRPAGGAADPHAQARELLAGRDITVPAALTAVQVQEAVATGDPRLAMAAAEAEDGRVIQFLAGAPELVSRYEAAPASERALLNTAIDARRLGMGGVLPRAFLEAAASGYLADVDWDALAEDWAGHLDQALARAAAPCKGVRGPLVLDRPRPGIPMRPAACRLADYLEQHGRWTRRTCFPPDSFWAAAACHANPEDLRALGDAAENRGLLREAARLYKKAAGFGDTIAAAHLIYLLYHLDPADHGPARWAVEHATLDEPSAVGYLLKALLQAGAQEQVFELIDLDPAVRVDLSNPAAVTSLLYALWQAGAQDQIMVLAAGAAARSSLEHPRDVADLLFALQEVGEHELVTVLAARAAAYVPVEEPDDVERLLRTAREVGAQKQVAVLFTRAAAHIPLEHAAGLAGLLYEMEEAGAQEQVTTLIDRAAALIDDAAARVPVDVPARVADVLYIAQMAGVQEHVAALIDRDPGAHAALNDTGAVAGLLLALCGTGAHDQDSALAARAAAHAPLDDPASVSSLLFALRMVGADEHVTVLISRDPAAHVAVDKLRAVADLLRELHEAAEHGQISALSARAAAHAPLNDPCDVADLLKVLRMVGADEHVTALIGRDPATRVTLDHRGDVIDLLHALRDADAHDQVIALMDRLPAEGHFLTLIQQGNLRELYRFGREPDGSAAPAWGWVDLD